MGCLDISADNTGFIGQYIGFLERFQISGYGYAYVSKYSALWSFVTIIIHVQILSKSGKKPLAGMSQARSGHVLFIC